MPDRWINVRQDQGTSNPDVLLLVYGEDTEWGVERHEIWFRFSHKNDSIWLIDELRRVADELEALL